MDKPDLCPHGSHTICGCQRRTQRGMSAGQRFIAAVAEGVKRLGDTPSSGHCPHCKTCAEDLGFKSVKAYDAAYEAGRVVDEPHFSWRPCQVCGTTLGGDRECFHYLRDGKVEHGERMCTDCMLYLANGDVPETWQASPGDEGV
jgi:hypothetical protein